MLYEFQNPEMLEQFGQIQYSQYGEDVVIWHWLETLGALKKGGIYVDVGAHHPRRMSNTYLLHKIMKWRGINIEPDPNLFKNFVDERPNDINLNIGCAGVAAEMELTIYNHPAANSLHPEMIARQAQNSAMEVVDRITIPVRPLRDVLKENLSETDQIGMLSVDAEGFDEEIIRSADLEIWKPTIVCVEAHNFDLMDPKANSLVDYMTSQGYSLKSFVMVTLIFARN